MCSGVCSTIWNESFKREYNRERGISVNVKTIAQSQAKELSSEKEVSGRKLEHVKELDQVLRETKSFKMRIGENMAGSTHLGHRGADGMEFS